MIYSSFRTALPGSFNVLLREKVNKSVIVTLSAFVSVGIILREESWIVDLLVGLAIHDHDISQEKCRRHTLTPK